MGFRKAERRYVKVKLALAGPAGGGKTMSGLRLAFGMGTKVAGIDSEKGSMSLYSDKFPAFDVLDIDPPYTTEKYIAAIKQAEAAGYEVLLIDSITPAWAGTGGLLEQKELLDARGGKQNRFANWGAITKKQEAFMAAILQANVHIICTMRSKTEYESTEDGKVKKLGLAPVQREGVDYEFTTIFDIDAGHMAMASKDRTSLFGDQIFQVTEETGKRIMAWLSTAAPALPPQWIMSREQLNALTRNAQLKGWQNSDVTTYMQKRWQKERTTTLLKDEYEALVLVLASYGPQAALEQLTLTDQPRHETEGTFAGPAPELNK